MDQRLGTFAASRHYPSGAAGIREQAASGAYGAMLTVTPVGPLMENDFRGEPPAGNL
jgi:hypothetical protein